MSKNKLFKFGEMETFPHVFQLSFNEIREGKTFDLKGNWGKSFFGNDNPIILELGCGKGEYTVGLATRFHDKNYIGVDIKGARIWSGAKFALEKQLSNVAFLRTTIDMLPHFFAENEVDEIWLTFPDPQMKKVRKRLLASNFLKLYSKVLKNNGILHLKTDSNFMFTYACAIVDCNGFDVVKNIPDLYASQDVDDVLNIKTFYEQQWLSRGITIKYIQFKLDKRENYTEPDIEIEYDSYRSFGRNRRIQPSKDEE